MVTLAVEETLSQSLCGGTNPPDGHLHVHNAVFNASALLLLLLPPLPPPYPEGLGEENCPSVCSLGRAEPRVGMPLGSNVFPGFKNSWIGEKALMRSLAPSC